jgi:hypothetical protein
LLTISEKKLGKSNRIVGEFILQNGILGHKNSVYGFSEFDVNRLEQFKKGKYIGNVKTTGETHYIESGRAKNYLKWMDEEENKQLKNEKSSYDASDNVPSSTRVLNMSVTHDEIVNQTDDRLIVEEAIEEMPVYGGNVTRWHLDTGVESSTFFSYDSNNNAIDGQQTHRQNLLGKAIRTLSRDNPSIFSLKSDNGMGFVGGVLVYFASQRGAGSYFSAEHKNDMSPDAYHELFNMLTSGEKVFEKVAKFGSIGGMKPRKFDYSKVWNEEPATKFLNFLFNDDGNKHHYSVGEKNYKRVLSALAEYAKDVPADILNTRTFLVTNELRKQLPDGFESPDVIISVRKNDEKLIPDYINHDISEFGSMSDNGPIQNRDDLVNYTKTVAKTGVVAVLVGFLGFLNTMFEDAVEFFL